MKNNNKRFTVKEFLSRTTGIKSFGVYDIDGNSISTEVDPIDILNFTEELVDKVTFFVYDKPVMNGDKEAYVLHHIRCNLYLAKTKAELEVE